MTSKTRRTWAELCEGALQASEYAKKVMDAKVSMRIRERAYALPAPWNKHQTGVTEATVLRACKEVLVLNRVNFDRIQAQGQLHHNGEHGILIQSPMRAMADLQICVLGMLGVLEIKKPGGHVSQHQLDWLIRKQESGAFAAIIVHPDGILKAIKFMQNKTMFDFKSIQGIPVLG